MELFLKILGIYVLSIPVLFLFGSIFHPLKRKKDPTTIWWPTLRLYGAKPTAVLSLSFLVSGLPNYKAYDWYMWRYEFLYLCKIIPLIPLIYSILQILAVLLNLFLGIITLVFPKKTKKTKAWEFTAIDLPSEGEAVWGMY